MQVKLITTITTVFEVTEEATFEEARNEIFGQYGNALDTDACQEQFIEAVQALQSNAVGDNILVAGEVTHDFVEVK